MGIDGIEELRELAEDDASEPQPSADSPTDTVDPDIPGDEPVQPTSPTGVPNGEPPSGPVVPDVEPNPEGE